MWESSFLKGRNYVQLLECLKADETGLLKNFNHMSSDFDFLLNEIEDKVSRVNTNYRDSIPASVRLALTLEVFGYRRLICQSHLPFPNFKAINIKNYFKSLRSHRRRTTGACKSKNRVCI